MYNETLANAYESVTSLRKKLEQRFFDIMGKTNRNRFLDLVYGRAEATEAEKMALKKAFSELKLPTVQDLFPELQHEPAA